MQQMCWQSASINMTGVFLHVNVCVWSHHPETERRSTRPAAQWAACHYSLLRLTLPAQTLSSQHISNQHLLLSSHLFPNSVWWSDRLHFLLNYCHCFLFFFGFFLKVCAPHMYCQCWKKPCTCRFTDRKKQLWPIKNRLKKIKLKFQYCKSL